MTNLPFSYLLIYTFKIHSNEDWVCLILLQNTTLNKKSLYFNNMAYSGSKPKLIMLSSDLLQTRALHPSQGSL